VTRFLLTLVLVSALGACGSTSAATDGGGSGGADGGGGACASAVAGGACSREGDSCGDCTDVCNFCNVLICTGGKWGTMESAPAPCFACGPSLQCQNNVQYCAAQMGGAVGNPAQYHCAPLPSSCQTTPTCACLIGTAAGNCTQAGPGQLTVTLLVP
jgi:hypothetical protein